MTQTDNSISRVCPSCGWPVNYFAPQHVCKNAVKSETVSPRDETNDWTRDYFRANPKSSFTEDDVSVMLEAYGAHIEKLSSQAIGAAAKEAAEELDRQCLITPSDKELVWPIILQAIEKARTK